MGKRWFIDEDEARVVRLIFDLYTSPKHRMGSKRIARHLNRFGHKTRTGAASLDRTDEGAVEDRGAERPNIQKAISRS